MVAEPGARHLLGMVRVRARCLRRWCTTCTRSATLVRPAVTAVPKSRRIRTRSEERTPSGPASPAHGPLSGALDCTRGLSNKIDTDMKVRPCDAERIPWLLVLDCAPQHVAKEFRSIMRNTRSHIKLCHVQRNYTAYTQPLDRAYMRAFKKSIRHEVVQHFADFFLETESNFEHVNLDSSTTVLRQLLLTLVHTAAQNADKSQLRQLLAGASSTGTRWSMERDSQKQNVFWRRENCFHEAQPNNLTRQMPRPRPATASHRRM